MCAKRAKLLSDFACLGAECEDTCCKAWDMQVNASCVAKYAAEAPELLQAVMEAPHGYIMRRDEKTDFCTQYDAGLCAVHKARGEGFLGDACHFYPRSTRYIGGVAVQTAATSCPEVVRLMLIDDDRWDYEEAAFERLPESIKPYGDAVGDKAFEVVQAFISHVKQASDAAQAMREVLSVSRSLTHQQVDAWPAATGFYLKMAGAGLVLPEPHVADAHWLLQSFILLATATGREIKPRLKEALAPMEAILGVTIDWQAASMMMDAAKADASPAKIKQVIAQYDKAINATMRRWLMGQLSLHAHPFGGVGGDAYAKSIMIAWRFAFVRLALLGAADAAGKLDDALMVKVIQPIMRVIDHLADDALFMAIADEYGWRREARLAALITFC